MADDIYFGSRSNKNNDDAESFGRLMNSRPGSRGGVSDSDRAYIDNDSPRRPAQRPPQRPAQQPPQQGAPAPSGSGKKKKKKRHPFRNFIIFLLVLIIALAGVCAGGIWSVASKLRKADVNVEAALSGSGYSLAYAKHDPSVMNILLIGQDSDTIDEYSRSDTMILVSVNTKTNKIKLTSFLRDSYVEIPGYGKNRLNAANVYGGPSLLMATIAYNFGIKIDHYVMVGYYTLGLIVDDLGGITLPELTEVESRMLAEAEIYLDPGENVKLNGWQALMYCRIRHLETDFERTARQRKMINLLINKLRTSSPLKIYKAATDAAYQCESDMTPTQLLTAGFKALPSIFADMEQLQIPAEGTWSYGTKQGMSVILLDTDENAAALEQYIYH